MLYVPQTPRLIPPDVATQLYYNLGENSAPLLNAGQAGALNITLVSGSAGIFNRTGVFAGCLGVSGASDYATANTSVGETSGNWSCHGWVNLVAYVNFAHSMGKQFRGDGTWTAPFASMDCGQLTNAGDGTWQCVISVPTATAKVITVGAPYKIPLNQWCHLGLTFDKNTGTAYFNGEVAGTVACGSNVSTDWGTHGRWLFGGNPAATTERANGRLNNWRFENTLRSAAYMRQVYKFGLGLFE